MIKTEKRKVLNVLSGGKIEVRLERSNKNIFDKYLNVNFGKRGYQLIQIYTDAAKAEANYNDSTTENFLEGLREESQYRYDINHIHVTMYLAMN
jgi:hypothetical protein